MKKNPPDYEIILLGTAQDAGVPQAGCSCQNCLQAYRDASRRPWIACLGIIDHRTTVVWMVDATPDFPSQLHLLSNVAPNYRLGGIFLTHAHMGHYLGLAHLGREAMNTAHLPIFGTASLGSFLSANAPWRQLVEIGNIDFHTLQPGEPVVLAQGLIIRGEQVPHRGEYSDTLAYRIEGPQRASLYCPDIDYWEETDLERLLADIDLAFVDGTFFDDSELPADRIKQVPHPRVRQSIARFSRYPAKVIFIHLNHTNPLWNDGAEKRWLEEQGGQVGETGARWEL